MHRISIFIVSAALAGAASAAAAQTPAAKSTPATAMKSESADTTFAQKAAMGGKKEVEEGKLVASKATNADVKAFGNRLAKDHSAANAELMKLMKTKHIAAGPAEKAEPEPWKTQTGAAFDRGFVEHAVADHEKDIALFESESKDGSDPELKAWAAKQLPTLREHLKIAQDLKSKLQTTTR